MANLAISKYQNYISILDELINDQHSYQSWGEVKILEGSHRLNATTVLRFKRKDETWLFQEIPLDHEKSLHAAIYRKRKNINALFITVQTHAAQVLQTIPPILDDQAQLLGPTLRYVELPHKVNHFSNTIIKGLRGRYGALLSNHQCICLGKSIQDAYVAAQLVEKTSKAFLEARHIGGAKSINRIEAWLMHKFYLLKYSKESEKNK